MDDEKKKSATPKGLKVFIVLAIIVFGGLIIFYSVKDNIGKPSKVRDDVLQEAKYLIKVVDKFLDAEIEDEKLDNAVSDFRSMYDGIDNPTHEEEMINIATWGIYSYYDKSSILDSRNEIAKAIHMKVRK